MSVTSVKIRIEEYLKRIDALADPCYAAFVNRLSVAQNPTTVLGVKISLLRQEVRCLRILANEVGVSPLLEALYKRAQNYNEYKLLYAVLSCSFATVGDVPALLKRVIALSDGWAYTDFAAPEVVRLLKRLEEKSPEEVTVGVRQLLSYAESEAPFERRFTVVSLMSLVKHKLLTPQEVAECARALQGDEAYYVRIAVAWTLVTLYSDAPEEVLPVLRTLTNERTRKLVMRKMRESRRIKELPTF